MLKISAAAIAATLLQAAFASEPVMIDDPAKIQKLVSQIPVTDKDMNYLNIGERLVKLGMTVSAVMYTKIEKKSEIELPEERIGDEWIEILTSDPPEPLRQHVCDVLGNPSYLKRGKRYIPQTKTAMWLMTSRCELPE